MQYIRGALDLEAELMELRQAIGAEKVSTIDQRPWREDSYTLHAPIRVTPTHEDDIVRLMLWASKHRLTITPQGGGTKDAMGEPHTPDVLLSMQHISGIVDYSPRDLTITVKAGTSIEQLQACLAEHGQYIPLDMPHAASSTIGGVFSANISGPRRAMYGSARDYLMAARVIYPDGRLLRVGAEVVKNVAGYDMNKLFIGAMGTLGVLTELTIRTRPIPISSGMVLATASIDQLKQLQKLLIDSQLEPSICEWLYGSFEQPIGITSQQPTVAIGFDDVSSAVQYQLEEAQRLCRACGIAEQRTSSDKTQVQTLYTVLGQLLPNAQQLEGRSLIVEMKLLSSIMDVSKVFEAVQSLAAAREIALQFAGGLYTGVSRVIFEASWEQQTEWIELISDVQRYMDSIQGYGIVECAPLSIRQKAAVWGQSGQDDELMKDIKRTIDPHHLLNAGRFIGGM